MTIRPPLVVKVHAVSRVAALVAVAATARTPLVLNPSLGVPFSQTNWPNPTTKPLQITNRGFLGPNRMIYRGQDRFYAGPGQVPTARWDNPRLPTRRQDFQRGSPVLLDGALGIPRRPIDWPNPRVVPRRQDQQQASTLLYSTVVAPFAQDDWPNPRIAPRRQDTAQQPPLTLTGAQAPFLLPAWDNPYRPAPRQDARSYGLSAPYIPQPVQPTYGVLAYMDAEPVALAAAISSERPASLSTIRSQLGLLEFSSSAQVATTAAVSSARPAASAAIVGQLALLEFMSNQAIAVTGLLSAAPEASSGDLL